MQARRTKLICSWAEFELMLLGRVLGFASQPMLEYLQGVALLRNERCSDSPRFYLRHVESADADVQRDALRRLNELPDVQLRLLQAEVDREQLVHWISSSDTESQLLCLALRLLPLVHRERDKALLEQILCSQDHPAQRQLGWVANCYIAISGESAVDFLEEIFLADPTAAGHRVGEIAWAIAYHADLNVRRCWLYGSGCYATSQPGAVKLGAVNRVSRTRAILAMRQALNRPESAPLAIRQLASWNDWLSGPRIARLAISSDDNSAMRRAAIEFLEASPRAGARDDADLLHVLQGNPNTIAKPEVTLDASAEGNR